MGQKPQKIAHAGTQGYKRLFGRLYIHRHDLEATPVLIIRDGQTIVPIDSLLPILEKNQTASNEDIVGLAARAGIKPSDIDTLRVFVHRFGFSLAAPLPLQAHAKRVVLLDENSPHSAVLSLSKNFGWATHVGLEGLVGRDTPDESIWEYAQGHKFGCIVTRDTDFLEIHKRRSALSNKEGEFVPLLVFVAQNLNTVVLTEMFRSHAHRLRQYMTTKENVACQISGTHDCHPLF